MVVTIVDGVLLERSKGFFRGGFLATDYLTGPGQTAVFLAVSFLIDLAFVGAVAVVAERLLGRTRLHPRARAVAGTLMGAGSLLAHDTVSYEILRYLGDAFDLALMWDLVGGNANEILAVASGHLTGLALAALGGCAAVAGAVWLVQRTSRDDEPRGVRTPLAVPGILTVAALVAMGVASTRSDVLENGLLRKPAGQAMTTILNGLTDVDRDGYGIVGRSSDADPFNAAVFPYAADVPGNGIDEDGVAGDLPSGVEPFHDPAPPDAPWVRRPDVVLVVLESFRADLVGARHEEKAITPVLDALARRGAASRAAYSHNGYTIQSRFHLFTGTLAAAPGSPTLIDDFKAKGYRVGYISGQDESFGGPLYDIGFTRAHVAKDARSARAERYSTASTPGSLAVPLAVVQRGVREFLTTVPADMPLFLCVNFHDTHYPYVHEGIAPLVSAERVSRERIVPEERDRVWATYVNTAANVDRAIGEVIAAVRAVRGREPGVVVTSDHGESLFDAGFLGHGYDLNEAQTRVPFVAANLPVALPEPFVQSDLRGVLLEAMTRPADESPRVQPRAASRRVFQYLGDLGRPRQVAFLRDGRRFIYDFRSDRVSAAGKPWVRPDELPNSDHEEFLALIHFWERIQLTRRPVWRRDT